MISPRPGEHVCVPMFDVVGEVEERNGEWLVVGFDGGTFAVRLEQVVAPSEHAKMRWYHRVGCDGGEESEEVARAWRRAVGLPPGHDMHGEEVRHDDATGATLVRKENAIVTVVDSDGRKPSLQRSIEDAAAGVSEE